METLPKAILLTPLPLNQDFTGLKAQALDFIQSYSDSIWSNLNPSDPGVTILDQVCFALTELGYCGDFSIPDLLTPENGKSTSANQFYLPERIMTTSPVTPQDYLKYAIDGVAGVTGALFETVNNVYSTYLRVDTNDGSETCEAVYFYLNKARNLGQRFLRPALFNPVFRQVNGKITVIDTIDTSEIKQQINVALQHYQLPLVKSAGYEELLAEGWNTDDIFNGPLLKNGWMPSIVGQKQDTITIAELNILILAVPGISSSAVTPVVVGCTEFSCGRGELMVLDFETLIVQKETSPFDSTLQAPEAASTTSAFLGAAHQAQTTFTQGTYRDIQNYYSIQNTFPETFAVGANAITANATPFQIAQSRQLKGYLTLFDQVIANQFAQLAGVGRLFSFKNTNSGAPWDEHAFYAFKDDEEKEHLEYPVPYQGFSPTYFYQSLYEVPHIRPLLKDHDALKFSTGLIGKKELEHQSWLAYKQDPYNAYMRGLAELTANEPRDIARRNDMLNHLLARHGASPMLFDTVINGSAYTGNQLKDRVIIKSLYLQNLDLLSYNRYRAYNYVGAGKLTYPLSPSEMEQLDEALIAYTDHDFLPDMHKIELLEKLTEQDTNDYAGIELQINLLLGLKSRYARAIRNRKEDHFEPCAADSVLQWMMARRKGMILIESQLLWRHVDIEFFLQGETQTYALSYVWYNNPATIPFKQAKYINRLFQSDVGATLIANAMDWGFLVLGSYFYWVNEVDSIDLPKAQPIFGTDFCFSFRVKDGEEIGSLIDNPVLRNRVDVVFPDFLKQQAGLLAQVEWLLDQSLPVTMVGECHFLPLPPNATHGPVFKNDFEKLIKDFINWHNTLIHYERNPRRYRLKIRRYAGAMAGYLLRFKLRDDE